MNYTEAMRAWFEDDLLGVALLLIALDFVLGTLAALKARNFRLAYIADFARNDVAFKLAPWGALYIGAKLTADQSWLIDGLDLGLVAGGFYAGIVLAWVGSIGNSIKELSADTSDAAKARGPGPALFGDENAAPPRD